MRAIARYLAMFASLSLLAATSPPVIAKDVRVSGLGVRKCSEWLDWKTSQNGEARAMALEWATGFISGHNIYAQVGKEQTNSVIADTKVIATLLDNYCQKLPESRLFVGVIDITQSLGGARVNLAPKNSPQANPKQDDVKGPKEL